MILRHLALLPQEGLPSQALMVIEYNALVEWQLAEENQMASREASCKATLSTTNILWTRTLVLLGCDTAPLANQFLVFCGNIVPLS